MKHAQPEGYMSIETVSSRLGVAERTIRNWLKAKTFPRPRRISGRPMWTDADLQVFVLFGKTSAKKLTADERKQLEAETRRNTDATWHSTCESLFAEETTADEPTLRQIKADIGLPTDCKNGRLYGRFKDLMERYQKLVRVAQQLALLADSTKAFVTKPPTELDAINAMMRAVQQNAATGDKAD